MNKPIFFWWPPNLFPFTFHLTFSSFYVFPCCLFRLVVQRAKLTRHNFWQLSTCFLDFFLFSLARPFIQTFYSFIQQIFLFSSPLVSPFIEGADETLRKKCFQYLYMSFHIFYFIFCLFVSTRRSFCSMKSSKASTGKCQPARRRRKSEEEKIKCNNIIQYSWLFHFVYFLCSLLLFIWKKEKKDKKKQIFFCKRRNHFEFM